MLFIDPYPWSFEYRPRDVTVAIRWATAQGWTPDDGPTRAMSFDDDAGEFVWLRDGERHLVWSNQSELTDSV